MVVTLNEEEIELDEYDMYVIENVSDTATYKIAVSGVMEEETYNFFHGIFSFVANILQTIKDIFSSFFDLFS